MFTQQIRSSWLRVRTSTLLLGKWLILAGVVGVLCGGIGAAFYHAIVGVTNLRTQHPWLLLTLPVAGLLIVALYKITGTEGQGTNEVIDAVQDGKPMQVLLLPAIFIASVLTHLAGGSAGREGAALQMGGDIGWHAGRLLHLSDHDCRVATICGMAAFFTALFGTPLAATMFAMMVINVGLVFYAAFIPAFAASLVAYGLCTMLHVAPVRFAVQAPETAPLPLLQTAGFGLACALVTMLFCGVLRLAGRWMQRWFPNPWLRILVGAAVLLAATFVCGSMRYNGAGTDVIKQAIEGGQALPQDFVLKILFTAVTLAAGYKGGEVVPSFFIGATFGCVAAPLFGIPAGFGAALGMIAVFCGATNCLFSSLALSVEVFGAQGLLYFAVVCGICHALTGYTGLYSHQGFVTAKMESEYHNDHRGHY